MRREAWREGERDAGKVQTNTPAWKPGRRAPPLTVQVAGPKSRTHDELRALADGPTRSIFVYDLDSNIPAADLEHGLHGLFSVFGPVLHVSSLPGWKDTAQAMVAYGSADHSKQAMGRLQNFPIWGRPLRLAYAQEDGSPTQGKDRPGPERPATAPQQRPAPSGLQPTAGDASEVAGVRRRIWDVPEVRAEQTDARDGADTQTPASSHGLESANWTESAMERFDRMVMERLVNNSHATSPVARPARPHGPSPGARNMRTTPAQADRGLLDADVRFLDNNVAGAPNGISAWRDHMPESLHAAHIPSESTIEEQSDTVTDGEEDVGGMLISGLGTSAQSDVEACSELPAATDSAASSAHAASDSDASDSSDLSGDDGGDEARGGGKGGNAVAWRDAPPAVGDMEEWEDYGDDGDVDMAALASLLGAGGGNNPGNLTQLQDVLTVTRCMRELDQLMGSLHSLQETEAHLRADQANALQPGLEEDDDDDDDEGHQTANGTRTKEGREDQEEQDVAASLANVEAEDVLEDVVSRFSNIQKKLAQIPPNFLQALGLPAPLLPAAPRAVGPAREEETEEDGSSVVDEGICAAEGVAAYEDLYECSRRPARGCRAQELGLDEAFSASTQESELETEMTAETEETGQESDDLEQTEAEVELQLRLEAENMEDAMLTSELERELQELSQLQGQITYLKEMLRKTKAQQRLLHSAEADEEISLPDSSAALTEDEDHDATAVAHAGAEIRRNGSTLRSNMRHPSVPHCRAAEGGVEDAHEDSVAAPESMEHVPRPHSRLSEGRPHSRLSEGRPASRLSWADDEVGRRFLPHDDSADFPTARPSSRPASRLSRLSESNASDSLCPTPDVDELDAVLLQSRAHLRDIRLAVLFSRTLGERSDRLHFLADFVDYFQGPQGAGQATHSSALGGSSAARSAASGGFFASQMAAGSGGAGRGQQGNTWTAADLEDGFGAEGDREEAGDGEDTDHDADAQAASVSRTSSGFSGLGSTAWSKFSTLPHRSPRSGSVSVGRESNGSGGFAINDEDGAAGDSDVAIASDSHASAGAAWENGRDVTELQVLHEIRLLPAQARREALLVIRRMSQGVPGTGHAAHAGHAPNTSASASRSSTSSTSPSHAARAVGGSSPARRTCLTKLTDSEPEDEAVMDEVPPGGAGVEETEDGEATASSWRSIEDDVSNDSTLARLAEPADAVRATTAAAAAAQSNASPDSSSSVEGYGSPTQRQRPGQDVQHTGRGNLSFTASPAAQRTPHRRNNYFVDNLELESPNKVPDDCSPCFDDDSEEHESLAGNCEDLVKDVHAQRAGALGSNRKARSRRAVAGAASSAPSPARSVKMIPKSRAGAQLCAYDYAESVSSVTESVQSSAMCSESDWGAEPNTEEDESESAVWGQSVHASHASDARHFAQATGDAWDMDVAKAVRRKIQTVIRERERVGFLNVSFTSTDLGGLAKLVERVLRNQGCKVDEQLRGMLHNALYKYCHAVMQHESEQLVQDVTEILRKERVFLEVVARVRRGYEQELRDYQQYSPAVRDKLVQQLRVRRDRDMMQLDKERRARGNSNVQYVHSDSPDDSGSRGSVQSDDFDAVLDAAVPVAPGAEVAGGSWETSRQWGEQVSSSAECATDDVESSSFGSTARAGSAGSVPSAASETVPGSSGSSAAILTPLKRSNANASPAKATTTHTPNRGAAVVAHASPGRQQTASADAGKRVVNGGAAMRPPPATAPTLRNGIADSSGGSSRSRSNDLGWMVGCKPASQPTSQAAKGKAKTDARHAASGCDGVGAAVSPLASRFQDGEFEEIIIHDFPQSAAPAARRRGEDDAVSRAQHALGRHRETTGDVGVAGVPHQAGGGVKKGGVMSFGPGGVKMPPNLAAALA